MAKTFYDAAAAARYDQLRSTHPPVLERIVERAGVAPGSRVLDLACGTGSVARAARSLRGCFAAGVDHSRDMLRRAAAKTPGLPLVLGDVAQLPFRGESFDAVVGSLFLHHVAPEKRLCVVAESYRVLSAGWAIFVTSDPGDIEKHLLGRFFPDFVRIDLERFPRIDDMRGWMEKSGFAAVGSERVPDSPRRIDAHYADWIERKPISTLDLIAAAQFREGMRKLRDHVARTAGAEEVHTRMNTLVFGRKT
jgi:SAM-dependent methyltransferase